MKKPCLIFWHRWTGWRQSPGECAKVNICLQCGKSEREENVHVWSAWSGVIDEQWSRHNNDGVILNTYIRHSQNRTCEICKLFERRYVE